MDIIEKQLEAYNARDLDRFISCYAPDVVIEDGDGNVLMRGQDEMLERYRTLFETSPELHGRLVNRVRIGQYVIDEEEITGINVEGSPSEMHGMVAYRVEGDKIVHVRMYS